MTSAGVSQAAMSKDACAKTLWKAGSCSIQVHELTRL